jgi:predicted RNA-binding Zn-ribbon protein involved in translation (DUF1610 family)
MTEDVILVCTKCGNDEKFSISYTETTVTFTCKQCGARVRHP